MSDLHVAALAPLEGLPLRSLGRAANLLWLHFGTLREVPTRSGGTKTVGDWALHIQCPWRLARQGEIVVASSDFYYNFAGDPLDDWDKSGKSRFDHAAAALSAEFEVNGPAVLSVTPDSFGGFTLWFAYYYHLDVFPNSSYPSTEHWRIFQPGKLESHFVFGHPA